MDCEKLIEFVKEHEILYDTSHPKYMDQHRKDKLWRLIAARMNQNESDCKKMWQNLRDSFRRVLKKRRSVHSREGKPKVWKYEGEMSFLVPHFTSRSGKPLDSIEPYQPPSEEEQSVENILEDIKHYSNIEPNESSSLVDNDEFTAKAKASNDNSSTALLKYMLESQERERVRMEEDDITSFFLNMAKTVRTFSRYRRAEAKNKVFTVISQLEFEQINEEKDQSFQTSDTMLKPQKGYYVGCDPLD
ncbi:Myb/SANT-like transcription factor [Oryctes borbonicus]|uniref:Myb/SANT-like transcription factor n=1 Tax=Oryctes borbonicus TaxID=1629725 RepID=A0A0T6B4L3_9SCAR|nr:Myb/SANT-like transcription factor [Oryctes borbonicus]